MVNKSAAVMQQRTESYDSLDDFPTPPWASRAFLARAGISGETVWEPAVNRRHLARVLQENFTTVLISDIADYGGNPVIDFTNFRTEKPVCEWMITNPPFKCAQRFIEVGCSVASKGLAVLVRTSFVEGKTRYEELFTKNPPSFMYQYVQRVSMVNGALDRNASGAASFCWLVWDFERTGQETVLRWIPAEREKYERDSDYE